MAKPTNADLNNLKNSLQFNTLAFLKNWIFLLTKMAKNVGRSLPPSLSGNAWKKPFFSGSLPYIWPIKNTTTTKEEAQPSLERVASELRRCQRRQRWSCFCSTPSPSPQLLRLPPTSVGCRLFPRLLTSGQYPFHYSSNFVRCLFFFLFFLKAPSKNCCFIGLSVFPKVSQM